MCDKDELARSYASRIWLVTEHNILILADFFRNVSSKESHLVINSTPELPSLGQILHHLCRSYIAFCDINPIGCD